MRYLHTSSGSPKPVFRHLKCMLRASGLETLKLRNIGSPMIILKPCVDA